MIKQQLLSEEQRDAGLAAAKGLGTCEFALATLAAKHGLRANELARIRVADLNMKERTIRIKPGKNSLHTVEGMKPETVEAIAAWIRVRPQSDYLFPQARNTKVPLSRVQVYRIFTSIAKAGNLPAVSRSPHAWRHFVGQTLADHGVPVQEIARVLRHKSIGSTMHYFKVSERRAAEVRSKYL